MDWEALKTIAGATGWILAITFSTLYGRTLRLPQPRDSKGRFTKRQ